MPTNRPPINAIITSPSLREEDNVSGISSLVSDVMSMFEDGSDVRFRHVIVGAKDGDRGFLTKVTNTLASVAELVRSLRGADLLHLNTSLNPKSIVRDSVLGLISAAKTTPIILHIHGGKYIDRKPNFMLEFLIQRLVSMSSRVILLSEREQSFFVSIYGVEKSISVLPNCVAPFNMGSSPNNLARSKAVSKLKAVFVGRLEHEKGLSIVVDAFSRDQKLRDEMEIDVFGAGSMRDWFCCEMTKLLGNDFRYRGIVNRSKIRELLLQYDLILLPSLFGEGLPMALLEGMAAGVVPVVSALASVPVVVAHEVSGLLLQPGSTDDLVEKLDWAVSHRKELAKMSRNAAVHVRSTYTTTGFRPALLEVYRSELAPSKDGIAASEANPVA